MNTLYTEIKPGTLVALYEFLTCPIMCIDDIFYEENANNTAIAGSFEKVISLLGEIVVPV